MVHNTPLSGRHAADARPHLTLVPSRSRVREWALAARITDDPIGDLIGDLRHDRDLPFLFRNIDAMRAHLRNRGACREALAAVPSAWRR